MQVEASLLSPQAMSMDCQLCILCFFPHFLIDSLSPLLTHYKTKIKKDLKVQ